EGDEDPDDDDDDDAEEADVAEPSASADQPDETDSPYAPEGGATVGVASAETPAKGGRENGGGGRRGRGRRGGRSGGGGGGGGEAAADSAPAVPASGGGGGGRRVGGRRQRAEPPQIQDVLKRGQSIIVQVSKEPISTKGPRVTAQVSIAGRFVVFMPFASRVGVSRKIGDRAERQRLREQVQKVLPKNSGGVIVRTVGEDVTQQTFQNEITTLINQWAKINKKT